MKHYILISVFLSVLLFGCVSEKDQVNLSDEEKLRMVHMMELQHFQSDTEKKVLQANHVKSAVYVSEIFPLDRTDSLTCANYDREGNIISRTTSGCTTIGCPPNPIRQVFRYSGGKINRIDYYNFENEYDSVKDYWSMRDTSQLRKFEEEDYNYPGDTVRVESDIADTRYVFNSEDKLVFRKQFFKKQDKLWETAYKYDNSKIKGSAQDRTKYPPVISTVSVKNKNKVLFKKIYSARRNMSREYLFTSNGLLKGTKYYDNDKLVGKTTISYTYYDE